MFKPKTTISGRLVNSSGGAIRTHDLRVIKSDRKTPFAGCLCLVGVGHRVAGVNPQAACVLVR